MRSLLAVTVLLVAACGGGGAATGPTGSETTSVTLAPPDSTTSTDAGDATTTSGPTTTEDPAPSTATSETTEGTDAPAVTPVITFEARTLTFARDLRVPLWATAEPETALTYRLVPSEDDAFADRCRIDGTDFVFETEPGPPSAPARCTVEVAGAQGEAATVVALVTVDRATWDVDIAPIDAEVSYSAAGGVLAVTVFENTGTAYEVFYEGGCGNTFDSGYAEPRPAPPGTTDYTFEIFLPQPDENAPTFECTLTVMAGPLDLGSGDDAVSFRVVP